MKPCDLQKALILAETQLWDYVREAARTRRIAELLLEREAGDDLPDLYSQKLREEESFTLYMQTRETLFKILAVTNEETEFHSIGRASGA